MAGVTTTNKATHFQKYLSFNRQQIGVLEIMMMHYCLWIFLSILLLDTTAFVPSRNNHHHAVFTRRFAKKKLSKADEERLLLSEPALTAFIVAEMRHFLTSKTKEEGRRLTMWELSESEKLKLQLVNDQGEVVNEEYETAKQNLTDAMAIDWLCNATQEAFVDGYTNEQGLLSALGSAILFFKQPLRASPKLLAACEQIGLSDYAVAHHITDMYHHRCFRGAYTKTLAPSGEGEIAARRAVGLEDVVEKKKPGTKTTKTKEGDEMRDDDDECLLWSPTTPGVCLHWKSDEEAWRRKRFERVQMEGTRDPRRGGSGTTR